MSSQLALKEAEGALVQALRSYAQTLSSLTPDQLPAAYEVTDRLLKLSDETRDGLRDRLLEMVQAGGELTTEKGTKKLEVGGFEVTAIPTRTGLDSKKVEAMLRASGKDPTAHMDTIITLKANTEKACRALTEAQIRECKYEPSFRVSIKRGTGE